MTTPQDPDKHQIHVEPLGDAKALLAFKSKVLRFANQPDPVEVLRDMADSKQFPMTNFADQRTADAAEQMREYLRAIADAADDARKRELLIILLAIATLLATTIIGLLQLT